MTGLCTTTSIRIFRSTGTRCIAADSAVEIIENDDDEWMRDDGTRQWLRWAVHPWRNAAGEIGGIIIFAEDITERRLR